MTEYDKGVNQGILIAMAVLKSHGDHLSQVAEDILDTAGKEEVIAYAKLSDDYEWSGLDEFELWEADECFDVQAYRSSKEKLK